MKSSKHNEQIFKFFLNKFIKKSGELFEKLAYNFNEKYSSSNIQEKQGIFIKNIKSAPEKLFKNSQIKFLKQDSSPDLLKIAQLTGEEAAKSAIVRGFNAGMNDKYAFNISNETDFKALEEKMSGAILALKGLMYRWVGLSVINVDPHVNTTVQTLWNEAMEHFSREQSSFRSSLYTNAEQDEATMPSGPMDSALLRNLTEEKERTKDTNQKESSGFFQTKKPEDGREMADIPEDSRETEQTSYSERGKINWKRK